MFAFRCALANSRGRDDEREKRVQEKICASCTLLRCYLSLRVLRDNFAASGVWANLLYCSAYWCFREICDTAASGCTCVRHTHTRIRTRALCHVHASPCRCRDRPAAVTKLLQVRRINLPLFLYSSLLSGEMMGHAGVSQVRIRCNVFQRLFSESFPCSHRKHLDTTESLPSKI